MTEPDFPADLSDPRKRLIVNEIPSLGQACLIRLKAWGFVTLGDLAKVGGVTEYATPGGVREYLPALLDINGLGKIRLLKIRLALHKHGLALVDEESMNKWVPLDVYASLDEGA